MTDQSMDFSADVYMMQQRDLNIAEEDYPFILNDVMKYIQEVKSQHRDNRDISLLELITEYSFQNEIDVETIGDIVASDVYFKSFVEKDCEYRSNNNDEW